VIEASFWAKENKETLVSADYVKRAIKEIRYRSSMIRDHILDTVNRGQILIDLEGKKCGQVNSLHIIETGNCEYEEVSRFFLYFRLIHPFESI